MKKQQWLIILLFFTSVYTFSQERPWKFVKETNGVKVYFRTIENSHLHEVKIQTTFTGNLSTIVEALKDVQAYTQWVYKAVNSYTVKEFNAYEMEYYNRIDFPFPLDDRDIVIHSIIQQNRQNKIVTSTSYAKPSVLPENKNMVRIKEFHSKWTFVPKNNLVYGEYVFSSDPGGNIPVWLVNLSLDEGPVRTIRNFKKQLLLDKYIKANSLNIIN